MYYYPTSKVLVRAWGLNFRTNIGPIGKRINEPAGDIAAAEANMDKLEADINNAELARQEWERLSAIASVTMKAVRKDTCKFVNRLKGNPLFTDNDAAMLQVISTTPIADLTDYTPVLAARETGGIIQIGFKKNGADSMNIYFRLQGETAFKFAASAKHSPYIFTPAPLAAGASQIYEFYGIPTLANTEVGHRSEIVSVKVNG